MTACNTDGIIVQDNTSAAPYPSQITVTGQPSYLCSMSVNLNDVTHTFVADMDVLLARLSGSNAIIMSDVGGSTGVAGVNLTLFDAAANALPAGAIVSGNYKPTNLTAGDTFPAPAPAPTGGSALSVFNGTNPNGVWNLWVADDASLDTGSIGGWCVNLVAVCTADSDCNDGNTCTNDACVNGQCVRTNNTDPCDDNNACTANDTCSGGLCVGGPPPSCDDGDPCTANICDTVSGQCTNPPLVCNDNNSCTDDACAPGFGCVFTPNDNNPCTDNSLCTTGDACVNGACVGQPVVCAPDANACTTEACDPATGNCASTNNNSPCDDGDVCTVGDACGPTLAENFDAEVAPNLPLTWTSTVTGTGDPWTTVSTSSDTAPNSAFGFDGPAVADEVLVSPIFNISSATAQLTFRNRWSFEFSSSCWDGGVLEIDIAGGGFQDIVAAGGSFVSGGYTGTVSSSFSNPLGGRSAWCGASTGYPNYLTTVVDLPAAAAGQAVQLQWRIGTDSIGGASGQNIDSIVLIDGTHVCTPGTGVLDCDDSNPCTDDFCDPSTGCQHANNTENCDDGNACTILDKCTAGSCGGTAIVCDDSNPCTSDSCDVLSGCQFTPIPVPGEVQGVTAAPDKNSYSWTATAAATQYDVVRGNVSALPVGPGAGDEVCFSNLAGPNLSDPSVPASGSAYWYLPRAENSCGAGTYGNQGVNGAPGAPRVTTTCP